MKYTKVFVELKGYENKLNRKMYIKEETDLIQSTVIILKALGSSFDHLFHLKDYDTSYILMLHGETRDSEKYALSAQIKDLNLENNAYYIYYDVFEYVFKVTVLDHNIELPSTSQGIVIDGKGYPMFEDNYASFIKLLNHEIDILDFANRKYFPSNVGEEFNLSQFFKPLNLEKINLELESIDNIAIEYYGVDEV